MKRLIAWRLEIWLGSRSFFPRIQTRPCAAVRNAPYDYEPVIEVEMEAMEEALERLEQNGGGIPRDQVMREHSLDWLRSCSGR